MTIRGLLVPKEFDLYQAARQLDTLCGLRVGVNLGWLRIATVQAEERRSVRQASSELL